MTQMIPEFGLEILTILKFTVSWFQKYRWTLLYVTSVSKFPVYKGFHNMQYRIRVENLPLSQKGTKYKACNHVNKPTHFWFLSFLVFVLLTFTIDSCVHSEIQVG